MLTHQPRKFDGSFLPRPRKAPSFSPLSTDTVDIEIGSGQGLFAIHQAQSAPARTLFAIEHTQTRYCKLQSRANNHRLHNLIPVHANAISWIYHHIPADAIDQIFLLYPNPFPKAKHRNQRWHQMPFMGFLLSRLKPDGQLHLATNISWYADEAESIMQHSWRACLLGHETFRLGDNKPFKPRTHFEQKYYRTHQTCHLLRFARSK